MWKVWRNVIYIEVLFESLEVRAIDYAKQVVLSLISSNLITDKSKDQTNQDL